MSAVERHPRVGSMLAIEIRHPGGPEVVVPTERPRPKPGRGELLIEVRAAGVNRPDIMQRRGLYPPPPGASDIPGLEVAGVVRELGEGVSGWRVGDRVCALVTGGGYAEFCVAPVETTLPVPKGLSLVEAAAVPETFFTVWANVFDLGRLASGERLLIHGGAGGVGTTAIQLAREVAKAEIYTTCGTEEKRRFCEALGARRAIDYRKEDFFQVIREEVGAVDLILDIIGGPYFAKHLKLLAPKGRLVIIAVQGGPKTGGVDLLPIMLRRLTVTGSTLRPRPLEEKAAIARALYRKVWPLLEAGRVRPVIYRTFPLERAADAHRLLESGCVIGKVVLTCRHVEPL